MRHHRWLLILPFFWQVVLVPWSNGVAARPFGLPFPMAWQMAGIVFTTLVIAVVFALDRRADRLVGGAADDRADAPSHARGADPADGR